MEEPAVETYQEERLLDQTELLIRALRTDAEGIRESAIAQLSLLGPKALPHLTKALSKSLEEVESQRPQPSPSSESVVTGLVRAMGIIRDANAAT